MLADLESDLLRVLSLLQLMMTSSKELTAKFKIKFKILTPIKKIFFGYCSRIGLAVKVSFLKG